MGKPATAANGDSASTLPDTLHVTNDDEPPIAEPKTRSNSSEAHFCAHTLSARAVVVHLQTDADHGLSSHDAAARLARDGPNSIQAGKGVSVWKIFVAQIANALTMILIAVMAISFAIEDYIEGAVVAAVILLNIVVGLVQDYRAEKTIQSLYALSSPRCKVIRDGCTDSIKADALVKGDVVVLATGDIVPADLRLVQGVNLSTDEAMLTGESIATSKKPEKIFEEEDIPLGDRTNLVFSGSTVTRGRGTGVVIATGMNTQIGEIAQLLDHSRSDQNGSPAAALWRRAYRTIRSILGLEGTPLQVTLSKFALLLFALAILLATIVFSVSRWDIDDEVLLYGICVGVAVIPESLLAVLTITMAVATKSMVKGHVIVRHLPSLEAVGGVTNICSDKTGTLTQGRMITRKVWLREGVEGSVDGAADPYDPTSGTVSWSKSIAGTCLQSFLKTLTLCNNATVNDLNRLTEPQTDTGSVTTIGKSASWEAIGEPTEIALKVFAMRFGINHDRPHLIAEHPFDSTVKLMSVVYPDAVDQTRHVFSKGAVEVMLPKLDEPDELKHQVLAKSEELASQGLRVLCIADKVVTDDRQDAQDRKSVESDLRFLGLAGIYDPPRPETATAVADCKRAGITVHMVTGDHVKTAAAIAREVGILEHNVLPSSTTVMAAAAFSGLTDAEIDAMDELPLVLARCSPADKVRMIEALHRRRAFCIMTGDGVNDSPALKKADIGIAMGDRGSDAAKEAADMVLTDDNFASIITGIREGRRLTDNIQKFLLHLLTTNLAQVILLLTGLAFRDIHGTPVFTLSPLEILWANLISSSPLALGLGLEEADADILRRPPRSRKTGVFTKDLIRDQLVYGVLKGILSLAAFMIVAYGASGQGFHRLAAGCNEDAAAGCELVFRARATTFATLTFLLLVTGWEVKHSRKSLFAMDERWAGPWSVFKTVYHNKFLFWSVVVGFLVTFPVVHIPVLNVEVFRHTGLGWEWGVVFESLFVFVALVELWKAAKRRYGWGKEEREDGGSLNV
ncbi:potassium/sodium efflux P-type ATPase [Plectosphaerella plurivora]|uniref:P-type Na(+) transporter n=1 Tax=Plectosphaerella plurivora TaxID=936078 RepID=A0A9P8V167_9PEZI|nr:potassium/sodium efflux P-type ATPase [Plectosphaerella plurivora]